MAYIPMFSDNWVLNDLVLVYKPQKFEFKSRVIITDLDECLITKLQPAKVFNRVNPQTPEIYDEKFVKKLIVEAETASIIIMSNQQSSKFNNAAIMVKLEQFLKITNLPLMAMFSLKNNKLKKPHTGMVRLLKEYYTHNKIRFPAKEDCMIISNKGGLIHCEKNGKRTFDSSDVDRAFAANCAFQYKTIREYVEPNHKPDEFVWNQSLLTPEQRIAYFEKLNSVPAIKPFEYINKLYANNKSNFTCLIFIYGLPRSGKTTLARAIKQEWDSTEIGETNALEIFGDDIKLAERTKKTEKLLHSRISCIIDGNCHSAKSREKLEAIAYELKCPVIYFEVVVEAFMARLFNHVLVETQIGNVELWKERDFIVYMGEINRVRSAIQYRPKIVYENDRVLLCGRF